MSIKTAQLYQVLLQKHVIVLVMQYVTLIYDYQLIGHVIHIQERVMIVDLFQGVLELHGMV